ncbi:MAG TPA: hypothetical protein VL049_02815, partial [Candidatus Dormibacteraeota bacterium]|nr:hypothetical protein [Candidatus Dormibacteraeota bacterium]
MRGWDWSPVIIGAVVCAAVIATGTATPAAAAQRIDAATQARLATLLGPQRLLRDFAPFTTERGEAAVQLAVSVVPAGAEVRGVELQLPLDLGFDVRGCSLAAAEANEVRATSWGSETLQLAYGPADELLASRGGETTLYTSEVAISPYAEAGPHRLSPSGFLVSDGSTRLHAVAT